MLVRVRKRKGYKKNSSSLVAQPSSHSSQTLVAKKIESRKPIFDSSNQTIAFTYSHLRHSFRLYIHFQYSI